MIPTFLNEKVSFVTNEEEGEIFSNMSENFKIIKTVGASVFNFNNSEFVQAYSTNQKIIVSFRVIYNRFTKDLTFKTKEYQILWNGQLYNIITAVQKDRNYVDVKAEVVF